MVFHGSKYVSQEISKIAHLFVPFLGQSFVRSTIILVSLMSKHQEMRKWRTKLSDICRQFLESQPSGKLDEKKFKKYFIRMTLDRFVFLNIFKSFVFSKIQIMNVRPIDLKKKICSLVRAKKYLYYKLSI